MKFEDIEDHFSENPSPFYDTFECPKCETQWGISKYGDPPSDIMEQVKCTCGAILKVSGEWVSNYHLNAEVSRDE